MSTSRSGSLGGPTRLLIVLFALCAVIYIFTPMILNVPIARAIEKHFDNTLVINKARLSMWPLRLELYDIHVKNPEGYSKNDMMTIGEIKVDADVTNSKTVIIKSIRYSEVAGYPEIVDNTDNFTAYKMYLKKKWDMIPTGVWRWPVAVETIQIRNGWTGNQEPLVKLDDRNFDPSGSLQSPVSIQEAAIQSFDNIVTQQRNALPKLMLESAKEKMGKVLESFGETLQKLAE